MSPDIPIGTEFAGYRITGVIGRGGMSIVYSAEHLSLGRVVALKVLSPMLAADEDFRERFNRESKLAASLDHPNIIPIYDAGDFQGQLYIAMRHIEGGDLGSLIKPDAPLGLGQTIFFIEQVAAALDHAHRRGLIHRDVKPANILVATPSDRVYLTDFGVVKQADTPGLTKTGYFLGTFAYAAPEQIERRPIDGRTDLYSLGCVLHECLSGKPPFDAYTEASMLHAHLVEPPPRLTDVRPDLPHTIDDVLAKALAKQKEDRYATCGDLVKALRDVALGTSVEPPPSPARTATETVLSRPETPAPAAPLPPSVVEPSVAAMGAEPPPPAPPPDTGTQAVPPPAPRQPRTVTLSGGKLIAIGAGALALLAVAVIAALALSGGDDDGTSAQTVPTTLATTTTQGTVVSGLSGVVPNAIFKNCHAAPIAIGAAETAECSPPATGGGAYYPDSIQFSLYPDAMTLQTAYESLRNANGVKQNFGRCSGVEWGGEASWMHGPDKPGGKQFCYFDGDAAVMVWTHEKLGQPTHIDMIGTVRSNSGDHSALFNWYRFWHHRIGKCDTPGCIAQV